MLVCPQRQCRKHNPQMLLEPKVEPTMEPTVVATVIATAIVLETAPFVEKESDETCIFLCVFEMEAAACSRCEV